MSLPEELRDGKIGRVPVWAIGVGIAGLVLVFMWFRNRGKSKDTDPTYDDFGGELVFDGSEEGVSGLPPGAIGDFLDRNATDPAYPVGLTPQGIPGPITNVQWVRLAFDWLIGQGNDPQLVERALQKYISGQPLTAAERAVVNLAQRAFGAPPEGLILTPETPPTPQIPPKNPGPLPPGRGSPRPGTTRRSVIVARYKTPNPPWNSTLWGIAQHYGRTVRQLQDWNFGTGSNRTVIYTGQRIWVDPA